MDQSTQVAAQNLEPEVRVAPRSEVRTFETIYADFRTPVYRYLRSRTRSDDEAADLASMTFERAFGSIGRLRPDAPPLPWLLRIARNCAIDAARRTHRTESLDDVPEIRQPRAHETPEDAYLAAERRHELRTRVLRLPEAQRDAVALRYAAGLTAREIGSVIGKSEAATQKLIRRALQALKETHDVER